MDIPKSLQQAHDYLQSNEPVKCFGVCNSILTDQPGLIQALYLRGCAALQIGDVAQSINDLDAVYGNHPEHSYAAWYFGQALRAAGRIAEALEPLQSALGEDDLKVRAHYEIAACLTQLRRRREAIEHYEAILALHPENAQVIANLASLLGRENRLQEAQVLNTKALQLDAGNETALMTQATLDRRSGRRAEAAERLRTLIPRISNPINRSIALNQLGQCLEGEEEWDAAFEAFTESNRILIKHHPAAIPDSRGPHGLQTLQRIDDWLKQDPIKDWRAPADQDPGGLVFLVGFPRSGTTLLDRMLSAHPQVEVLEEKSLFSLLHQDWATAGVLEALTDVADEQIIDARDIYRRELLRHRLQPDLPVVIDKLPLNLAYLFLIQRLFPKAPIIYLQRHPIDTCISCYSQAFELEASMGYFLDVELTAQYYDAVMRVAKKSFEQICNPVLSLRYEDLVSEPKSQLARLTDFLRLRFNDSMLDFQRQETGETSNTPSFQQVSEPLYTRSIGRCRHYLKHFEAGMAHLRPWVERFGYQEESARCGAD